MGKTATHAGGICLKAGAVMEQSLCKWDDDGSLQWQDQASFIVAPPLNEILKIKGGKSD